MDDTAYICRRFEDFSGVVERQPPPVKWNTDFSRYSIPSDTDMFSMNHEVVIEFCDDKQTYYKNVSLSSGVISGNLTTLQIASAMYDISVEVICDSIAYVFPRLGLGEVQIDLQKDSESQMWNLPFTFDKPFLFAPSIYTPCGITMITPRCNGKIIVRWTNIYCCNENLQRELGEWKGVVYHKSNYKTKYLNGYVTIETPECFLRFEGEEYELPKITVKTDLDFVHTNKTVNDIFYNNRSWVF
jgi:hypothetical protein